MNAAAAWLCWPPGPLNDAPGSVRHLGDSTQTVCTYSRAKLSPFLRPLTIRQAGGTSPRYPFESITCRPRASEARQARRAAPCGQGLRRCGHVGNLKGCPSCPCCRCSCPSGSTSKPFGRSFGWGLGRGRGRIAGQRGPRPAGGVWPASRAGLVSVSTTCTKHLAGYDLACLLLTRIPF